MLTEELVAGIIDGDRRAVARAISKVEDGDPLLAELSAGVYPHTGGAYTVGITGSPGVGKSSLAEQLVRTARAEETTVAVLAIDPTSPFTGGALLGDRLRMQAHATDPGVFIRSMATRGHLGGMALAAPEAIRILDASGKDIVIVETVGVGQAEVEVAKATDTTLVVVTPGWGDSIQVAKAGILEIADVFVVNKADLDGADRAASDIEAMLAMSPQGGWIPPVIRNSTVTAEGNEELWQAIEDHRRSLEESGELKARRRERLLAEVREMISQVWRGRASTLIAEHADVVRDLEDQRLDPYAAASKLLEA
jgi:LAO/AO transport system kinase